MVRTTWSQGCHTLVTSLKFLYGVDSSAQRILAAISDVANLTNATNGAVHSFTKLLLGAIFNVSNVTNATSSAVVSDNDKLTSLIHLPRASSVK